MITKAFFKNWLQQFDDTSWSKIHNSLKNDIGFDEYYGCNYNKVKGDIFEFLTKYIYLFDNYQVYLYDEIPYKLKQKLGLPSTDKGIDLIISEDGEEWIGVQCKWRGKFSCSIQKKYVTEFMHEINNSGLSYGIFFTNVKYITPRFDKIDNLKWSVRSDLLEYVTDDLLDFIKGELSKKDKVKTVKVKQLRDYQVEAVKKLTKSNEKKMQCIMACGTGKTVVMMEYVKQNNFKTKKILFLFPSLQLINQIYKRFVSYVGSPNILCICSDLDTKSLTEGEADSEEEKDIYNEFLARDTKKIFTTDPDIIKERLEAENIVVFSTYQSSNLLKGQEFDIGLFDEAHKTVNSASFGYCLDDDNCIINKRLFFTATPRYYKGKEDACISMNNEDIYGKEVYNYTFKEAIADEYILDFQLVCYVTPPKLADLVTEKYIKMDGIDNDANSVVSAIQLAQHIQKYGNSKRILTYHNSIKKATDFKKTLNYVFDKFGLNADVFVMSGKTKLTAREEIFDEFKESSIGIICSSRVLNEGVDIPCVDTVMFVDPRKSTIDVTQCVGRGMRLFAGTEKCTVIIPIHYDNIEGEHQFSPVINILTAMNEIDSSIIEYFVSKKKNTKISIGKMGVIVDIDMDSDDVQYSLNDVKDGLMVKVMDSRQLSWEYKKELLFEYCDKYNKMLQKREKYKGYALGYWYQDQKKKINSDTHDIYIKLAENKYVKENLDEYLDPWKKWDENKQLLFEYCDKNLCTPPAKKKYKKVNVGTWLHTQKGEINNNTDEKYIKLSKNKYVKESLDTYLEYKKETKDKIKLEWNEWKVLLFEYCDKNKHGPLQKATYKNKNIGTWFTNQKRYIKNNTDEIYIKLSENKYVKEKLDEFIDPWKKWEEWKKLLFEYCDENKGTLTWKTKYKGHNIGKWLGHQKEKINENTDEIYIKLSKNKYIKDNLDEYLDPWKKWKKWNEWKKLLFEYCDKNKSIPPHKTKYKNVNIGGWLHTQKGEINNNTDEKYIKLSKNKYVKESLDTYLDPWKKWNEWKDLLFEYCEENKKTPFNKTKYKNANIGSWLSNQKNKINKSTDEIYIKLSKNKYVKENLNECLEYKKENKDKIKLEWNEWKKLLFEYCDRNKKTPFGKTKYKNVNIGHWLSDQKQKINNYTDNIYIRLSENEYVKKNLDEYIKYKKDNKNKIKLEWDEWKYLLFEYCDKNKCTPLQKTKYKNVNIGGWLFHQKEKITKNTDEIYIKLSENKYVKQNLDKYLANKSTK